MYNADDVKFFCTIWILRAKRHSCRYDWSIENKFDLNIRKSNTISIFTNAVVHFYRTILRLVDKVNLIKWRLLRLRVHFDTSISCSHRIDSVVSKTVNLAGFITAYFNDLDAITRLYKTSEFVYLSALHGNLGKHQVSRDYATITISFSRSKYWKI